MTVDAPPRPATEANDQAGDDSEMIGEGGPKLIPRAPYILRIGSNVP